MNEGPINPLGPDDERLRQQERHLAEVELAKGKARTAEDWFDIYISVVEHGVKTVCEAHGESAVERLAEQRPSFAAVRHVLKYQGLPLTETMEWEGPEYVADENGFYHSLLWPRGQWIKITWPDRDHVEFRGQQAVVAATFLLWWQQFQDLAMAQQASLTGQQQASSRRLIEPGSPEWLNYFAAKAKRDGGA